MTAIPLILRSTQPPPSAKRYASSMGGTTAVIEKANKYVARRDLRFAATLLNHAVFADPDDEEAKEKPACVYDKLGHGAENATWRNLYLVGALDCKRASPGQRTRSRRRQ